MMKKMMTIMLAAVLAIGVWTGSAVAQDGGKAGAPAANAQEARKYFVDGNNDGICDNRQNGRGSGHHRENGCFVDADNDGICDNAADGTCTQNGGRNRQNRNARFGGHSRWHRR